MKLCKTCIPKKNVTTLTTTKTKKLWKKGFGTKSEFPNDKKPKLKSIKKRHPKKATINVEIDLGEKFKNRMICYYASRRGTECGQMLNWDKAYGKFQNSGITKLDNKGKEILKVMRPQAYVEDGETYFPHVHFLLTNSNNTQWVNKLYTKAVIIKIDKTELKRHIKSGCYMILNALDYKYYIKDRIPRSLPLPHKLLGKDIEEKHVDKYLKKMLVHYPKILEKIKNKQLTLKQIPIITYCYSKTCDASQKLLNKLWQMGYNNIIEYPGGIMEWLHN